ncbi:MAG TPA: hypothetical protein VFI08_00870, partial [Spirochaetia bacterium]|nr:hypothetical protein [Spirochaetia bacterium]
GIPSFAQLASDPNDRMYTDLKQWEDRGLLPSLPQLRPYPIQLLKTLLSTVQDRGTPDDAARAREYYGQIDGEIQFHPGVGAETRTDGNEVYTQLTIGSPFQGTLDPAVTYSGWLAGVVNNAPGDAVLPEYGRSTVDYITDGGVHPIGSTGFTPRVSSASAAALGSDTFYFQAGDIRGSWGPFWGDNAVLSPLSPQTGQFSLVYRGQSFTVSESVMALSAVDSTGAGTPTSGKYLALHGLDVYPLPWLSVGIFESVVWGGRFELLYLLPFAVHYYTQGLVGFPDNSFIGVNATVRLPEAVRLDFLFYFDDMSFNDLIRLNFNTRMKFAFQTGATWAPDRPLLKSLAVEALVVTPYTYSHQDDTTDLTKANYEDYTNSGQNIGPSLQPDSLRLEARALLRPLPALDVTPFARLILHGNASSDAPFPDSGNGTIFDNGYTTSGEAFNTFRFLTQSVIEKTIQVGASGAIYLHLPVGTGKVFLEETLQYRMDAGLVRGDTALSNFLTAGLYWQY